MVFVVISNLILMFSSISRIKAPSNLSLISFFFLVLAFLTALARVLTAKGFIKEDLYLSILYLHAADRISLVYVESSGGFLYLIHRNIKILINRFSTF